MIEPPIFTTSAATKVWELIQEEGNDQLKLRVYVTGGGCSGFQYGFTFDETVQSEDTVVTKLLNIESADHNDQKNVTHAKVDLLVDPLSLQYLTGAEIDYQEDIKGEQFIIRNPNAKTTCGCGSSFTTE